MGRIVSYHLEQKVTNFPTFYEKNPLDKSGIRKRVRGEGLSP